MSLKSYSPEGMCSKARQRALRRGSSNLLCRFGFLPATVIMVSLILPWHWRYEEQEGVLYGPGIAD